MDALGKKTPSWEKSHHSCGWAGKSGSRPVGDWLNSSQFPRANASARVGNILLPCFVLVLLLFSCGLCCSLMPDYLNSQLAQTRDLLFGSLQGWPEGWLHECPCGLLLLTHLTLRQSPMPDSLLSLPTWHTNIRILPSPIIWRRDTSSGTF